MTFRNLNNNEHHLFIEWHSKTKSNGITYIVEIWTNVGGHRTYNFCPEVIF